MKKELIIIAGNCVIEHFHTLEKTAKKLSQISIDLGIIDMILKGSYSKANRTHIDSFKSIGKERALKILQEIGGMHALETLTDVHQTGEIAMATHYVNMLQIPAFLCRQTDLLTAAGHTGLPVNIKKGQFMSGENMKYAAEKISRTGNTNIMLTERGTMFGYHDLVVDFRNIPQMKSTGYPVLMDITHSLQKPNQIITGGNHEWAEFMARLALTAGVDGIYFETHPDPSQALSDRETQIPLNMVEGMLDRLLNLHAKLNL